MKLLSLEVSHQRNYFLSFCSDDRVRISQAFASRLFDRHDPIHVTYGRGEGGAPHLAVTEVPGDVDEETRQPRRNQYRTEIYSVRMHRVLQTQWGTANDEQRLYWTGRVREDDTWTCYELSTDPK